MRGAFGKLGTGIKGAAGQVPILGGAMTALANPSDGRRGGRGRCRRGPGQDGGPDRRH